MMEITSTMKAQILLREEKRVFQFAPWMRGASPA
jgi:hypothetical protein